MTMTGALGLQLAARRCVALIEHDQLCNCLGERMDEQERQACEQRRTWQILLDDLEHARAQQRHVQRRQHSAAQRVCCSVLQLQQRDWRHVQSLAQASNELYYAQCLLYRMSLLLYKLAVHALRRGARQNSLLPFARNAPRHSHSI